MFGNIWLSSAFAVIAIFSASIAYKSYSDLQEIREVQENYEIIRDIKILLSKQYNKSPEDITRDEIIAYLPKGGNWEKVLLVNRKNSSTLSTDALVNSDGNIVLNENEKLKVLVLSAKQEKYGNESTIIKEEDIYTFKVGEEEKNHNYKDNIISNRIIITIEILDLNRADLSTTSVNTIIKENTPYTSIYQIVRKTSELDDAFKSRKEDYFRDRIKETLSSSKNRKDMRIYSAVKGLL